jgi:translation initiation factor 2 alpha subunit (eIF-2alpha)|tara:strand:- start:30 stop:737 length:708 start_codon:yes stop_codon:yes gene_type:complete
MKEGDLILCKVKKVTNTITFVEMPNGQEGTIISSEIAAGRIKLMRQYVVPNKQIVCKVLRVEGDHAHLSLRRVNSKERKEVMQKAKQSQAIKVAFKQILKEEEDKVKEKILKDFEDLTEFIIAVRTDSSLIQKYIPKESREAIEKIINKKRKNEQMKQTIKIKCLEDDGVTRIKKIFNVKNDNVKVSYISAGKFSLNLTVEDFKQGKKEMIEILEELEKRAKENNCEFFASEDKQ